jgi:hypothetical protein
VNTELRVLLAQVAGLAVLLAGNFGIELSAEDKLTVINGITATGLVISGVVAYWPRVRALFGKKETP